jgi:hypothetical protein
MSEPDIEVKVSIVPGVRMLRLIEDVHHIEVYMNDSRMVKFFPKDLELAPPKEAGVYAFNGKEWWDVFTVPPGKEFTLRGPAIMIGKPEEET